MFFLENVILLRQALVNLRSKLKNKQFFRPNLFGNIYSALNFLAKGIKYVKLFRLKKTSFQTLLADGLDLLLKKKGMPSIKEITSGEKTVNL